MISRNDVTGPVAGHLDNVKHLLVIGKEGVSLLLSKYFLKFPIVPE